MSRKFYKNPPIVSHLMEAQINAPNGYNPLFMYNVWELFRNNFPKIEVGNPVTQPDESVETQHMYNQQVQVQVQQASIHPCYYFFSEEYISEQGGEFLRFQGDQIARIWQKGKAEDSNHYPEFENLLAKFETELSELHNHYTNFTPKSLKPTEKSDGPILFRNIALQYQNRINLNHGRNLSIANWIRGDLGLDSINSESFFLGFSRKIDLGEIASVARLKVQIGSLKTADSENMVGITLTLRGTLTQGSVGNAVQFYKTAHDRISDEFESLTTLDAKNFWGKNDT